MGKKRSKGSLVFGASSAWVVLIETDPAAPAAVRCWCEERVRLGLDGADDPRITEALAWAERVEAGLRAHLTRAQQSPGEDV